jgi:hypothetical protein
MRNSKHPDNLNTNVGAFVKVGDTLFSLVQNTEWWVMANFLETEIEQIRVGQEVAVYIYAYPGHRFKGTVQGIGWALNEEYIYGKDGRLQNPGFLDYRIPVCSDLPMIDTILIETKPNPRHPYGAKGVGEVPIVPPLAAVSNAVSRIVGKRMTSLPMSPAKVLAESMKLSVRPMNEPWAQRQVLVCVKKDRPAKPSLTLLINHLTA